MKQRGFTITELMVIIVVLAILISIGIFGYGSWRRDSMRKAITADLKAASTAMEQSRNFHNEYPTTLPSSFKKNSTSITVSLKHATAQSYCLEGASGSSGEVTLHLMSGSDRVEEGAC